MQVLPESAEEKDASGDTKKEKGGGGAGQGSG